MSSLTDKQIEAQVISIRRSVKNGAQYVAIRAASDWTGPERMSIDGIEHLVMPCVSDLQVREALLTAEQANLPAVLLCSVSGDALGDDVIDRLARRRVFAPQVKDMVAELFSVTPGRIDLRVIKNKALLDALLDYVPAEGYPPVASGTLDLQTAWKALLSRVLGERIETPSLVHFLEWSLSEEKRRRLSGMHAELKAGFVEWFSVSRGDSVGFMMAAMDADYGPDLVSLGAALGLVFDPVHHRDAENQAARGRLDRYFGHRSIDPESAHSWYRAAEVMLKQLDTDNETQVLRPLLARLDELINDLQLPDSAWVSDYSPRGLEQRYQQLGQALKKATKAKSSADLDTVQGGISQVRRHLLGVADTDRLSRVEMACRLIRWMQTDEAGKDPLPFDGQVHDYHRDGGFVDWARNRLKETDESPEVQKAYDAILKRVDERADTVEHAFAEHLREWTRNESSSDRVILIEDVLKRVVTPVAKQQPVLLLVLDGMSVAVFRRLLKDILRHDWAEIVKEDVGLPHPVLAALPSVTNISRRALFLGRLDPGTNGTEEGEFKNNEFLFKETGSQVRPQLFKKGVLTDDSQGGIAPDVRDAIADKKCRVVSVVLNAIDDHLDSGTQVNLDWNRDSIKGLRDLLRQASESERLVILTSDHGHVLDYGTKQVKCEKDGRGDRYRPATGQVVEGEMEFEGDRVRKAVGENRITLAWSTKIRYGGNKRGYHGGANPQEMVVPLAILSDVRSEMPAGWQEVPSYQPDWWRIDGSEAIPEPVKKPEPEQAVAGLELFEQAGVQIEGQQANWIADLLASERYKEQAKQAVRGAPKPELMQKLLGGLEARGGTGIKQALSQDLGMPPFRMDGLLQNVTRILNVEGYDVLVLDRASDTVTLNIELLRTQFDLKR